MKRIGVLTKSTVMGSAVCVGVAMLSGCAPGDPFVDARLDKSAATTSVSPTPKIGPAGINESGSRYFADWVQLPGNLQVLCVRFEYPNGTGGGATMSCRWDHVIPAGARPVGG